LIETALAEKYIDEAELALLKEWKKNPADWLKQ